MSPQCKELVIPPKERKTVRTLMRDDCRWPIGDPQHADFHFCGKQKRAGSSYCDFHARRGFQPSQPRRHYQSGLPGRASPAVALKALELAK